MNDPNLPQYRANREITARAVRLIDADGTVSATMPIYRALALANRAGCDLIEVGPYYHPPVCRLMRKSLDDL